MDVAHQGAADPLAPPVGRYGHRLELGDRLAGVERRLALAQAVDGEADGLMVVQGQREGGLAFAELSTEPLLAAAQGLGRRTDRRHARTRGRQRAMVLEQRQPQGLCRVEQLQAAVDDADSGAQAARSRSLKAR